MAVWASLVWSTSRRRTLAKKTPGCHLDSDWSSCLRHIVAYASITLCKDHNKLGFVFLHFLVGLCFLFFLTDSVSLREAVSPCKPPKATMTAGTPGAVIFIGILPWRIILTISNSRQSQVLDLWGYSKHPLLGNIWHVSLVYSWGVCALQTCWVSFPFSLVSLIAWCILSWYRIYVTLANVGTSPELSFPFLITSWVFSLVLHGTWSWCLSTSPPV